MDADMPKSARMTLAERKRARTKSAQNCVRIVPATVASAFVFQID
jgi:hypothetical protein